MSVLAGKELDCTRHKVRPTSGAGSQYFDNLHVGGNATYTSERIIHKFILHMSNQIEKDLLQQLVNSPCVSLMCDETTDISVLK